jgi:hypothetical protein
MGRESRLISLWVLFAPAGGTFVVLSGSYSLYYIRGILIESFKKVFFPNLRQTIDRR